MLRAILSLGLAATAYGGAITTSLGGTVSGNFEFLGSLCFAAGSTAEVTIDVSNYTPSTEPSLEILFYDDQADSFDQLMKIGQSCTQRVQMSKKLCSGPDACVSGYRVGVDANPLTISITESIPREWFFVASDCGGAKITMTYDIKSDNAIDCDTMHLSEVGNSNGYVVAVVFLVIFVAILASTTVIFYRKSQNPNFAGAMPENYEQL